MVGWRRLKARKRWKICFSLDRMVEISTRLHCLSLPWLAGPTLMIERIPGVYHRGACISSVKPKRGRRGVLYCIDALDLLVVRSQ